MKKEQEEQNSVPDRIPFPVQDGDDDTGNTKSS